MMEFVRKITTRQEAAEELIDLGVRGIALDIALKAGAPRRHRDRVHLIKHQLAHDLQKRFGEIEMIRNWSVGLCAMELTTSIAA
ncbi:MAG: hypothetical protein QHG98_09745, partial [Methanothrix sp.]|nr:hypothetical protein [Methanothrix sp.]